jgi:hypothetical protein
VTKPNAFFSPRIEERRIPAPQQLPRAKPNALVKYRHPHHIASRWSPCWSLTVASGTIGLLIVTTFIAQMIDGAVPPNEGGTSDVSRQRQRRLDRMAIRRETTTNQRLSRQRELKQRQQFRRDQDREQHRQARAQMTPEQLEVRQQQDRDRRAEMTPERLEFRQQQDRDRHSQARAEMTPERLEFRQQQDRQQHSQARAELTPEQLEDWQQQRRDQHRRTTAAESGDDDDHAVSL